MKSLKEVKAQKDRREEPEALPRTSNQKATDSVWRQCRVNRKAMQTPWLEVSGGDGNYQQYHQSFDVLQFTKCFL